MIQTEQFEANWGWLRNKNLYVACSGGVDSVVLVHLLSSFCDSITLLHVNYGLRGADSDADESFVKALGSQLAFPVEVLSLNLADLLQKSGGNLQDEARKIRYDWFSSFLSQDQDAYLLLGHHADDQLETFYLQLARGGGLRALACMPVQQQNKIRPLIPYFRDDILHYAQLHKLNWREDLSNLKPEYGRNRLRLEILPDLFRKFPNLKSAVLTLIDVFQQELSGIKESAKVHLTNLEKGLPISAILFESGQEEVLNELLIHFGFLVGQQEAVRQLADAQKGSYLQHGSWRLIKEREGLVFKAIELDIVLPDLLIEAVKELPDLFDLQTIYLDASAIQGNLVLRRWKFGDRIKPVGMKGSKLISDILTDNQLPHHLRAEQLVLCDDVEIHWCVGHKIGRKALAHKDCDQILRVALKK